MFKQQDTMFVVEPETGEDFIFASKIGEVWLCKLCSASEEYKVRMLEHVRFHIEVK